jgi:hypothetical protein
MRCTELRYDGRLMNRIVPGSKFKSVKHTKTETDQDREIIARELIHGWVENADHDRRLFTITHGTLRNVDPVMVHGREQPKQEFTADS